MTSALREESTAATSTAATGSNSTAYQTTMNNSRINKRGQREKHEAKYNKRISSSVFSLNEFNIHFKRNAEVTFKKIFLQWNQLLIPGDFTGCIKIYISIQVYFCGKLSIFMRKPNSYLCELIRLYRCLHRLSRCAQRCLATKYVHCTMLCVCTLAFAKSVSRKFRVHLLVNKFSRGRRRATRECGQSRENWENLCTVNNAEFESKTETRRLKRLRHTSIKLKSAKWVFLRDLHRLNCNGFLFLVSSADIMMWPLLLLWLLLMLLLLYFVFCCCSFCVLVFSAC